MLIELWSDNWLLNLCGIISLFVFLLVGVMLGTPVVASFRKSKKWEKFTPKISIVIPCYNGEATIARCVRAIAISTYPKSLIEIIIIDDGSKDDTQKRIKSIAKRDKRVRYIHQEHSGKASALNRGAKAAKYPFILTIDADTYVSEKFIERIIEPFSNKEVAATHGMGFVNKPRKWIEFYQDVEYSMNNLIREAFGKVSDRSMWFFGAAACFRKSALEKAGFFSTQTLTEDLHASLKIMRQGSRIITVGSALYNTAVPSTFKGLIRQRARWFGGGFQSLIDNRALLALRSGPVYFLFANQFFWSSFSLVAFPLFTFQIFYWWPQADSLSYLLRWFSAFGPIYALYKTPEWGIRFVSIFGILAGLMSSILLLFAAFRFRRRIGIGQALAISFFFPYTLVLNVAWILAVYKYITNKKASFR